MSINRIICNITKIFPYDSERETLSWFSHFYRNSRMVYKNVTLGFRKFSDMFSASCDNTHEPVLQRCVRRVKESAKVLNIATQWSHV